MRFRMLGILLLLQFLASCKAHLTSQLTIATASNLQFVMQELSQAFQQTTGIPCQTIVSSSGKLTAQIRAGAPYDVLLSADMKYPNWLNQEGLTHSSPRVYAFGQLVLWTMKNTINPSLSDLSSASIRHIAIANPQTAPYGQAALASLETLGLKQQVQSKLVYGEAIAQVNQFVTTKAVDIGFTAKSVVLAPQIAGKGTWVSVIHSYHPPITQGVVILKNTPVRLKQAQKFQDFLFSAKAQKILQQYGYRVN